MMNKCPCCDSEVKFKPREEQMVVIGDQGNWTVCQTCTPGLAEQVDLMMMIVRILQGYRFNITDEAELQEGISRVLRERGLTFEREYSLSSADRIDFLVNNIGVEIKIGSSRAQVLRQLHRYAQHEEIKGLVVVTTKATHTIPDFISRKPVMLLNLSVGGSF